MSTGAKAGIIAGSILLVGGISVLAAYLVAKKNKEESRPPKTFPVFKNNSADKVLNSHDNATVVPLAVSPYVMPPEDIGEEREENSLADIEEFKGKYSIYTDSASFEGVGDDLFDSPASDVSVDNPASDGAEGASDGE